MRLRFAFRGTLAVLLCAASAAASAVELYGGVGTTGFELGVAQGLAGPFGVRIEANAASVKRDFEAGGIDYDAKLKLRNAGIYLDWFAAGTFRLTAGALVGSRKIDGRAKSMADTIEFNGVDYPVGPDDRLDFRAKTPTFAPYLGIGFGHPAEATGLRFYGDLGVAYGRPKVRLSPSASLAAKVSAADIAAEERSAQDKADDYRFYPVLKLGIGYAF